ncbi:IS3 family transposase [Paenibacillus sp. FSL L8-0638]|uniref:IS3 family transposase n=1 Tax=Paenibacillus TaxID=44249 RepID=UPI003158BB28
MTKKERRTFSAEFKAQMVQLYQSGKARKDIIQEYDLNPSSLDKWVKQSSTSGSFKEKDNRTPEELELLELRKQNKQLLMENDIFKASRADHGTKVNVIRQNKHKYSVSAMCDVLKLPRSTYYYEENKVEVTSEGELPSLIMDIFQSSRQNYGTRKIKKALHQQGSTVSRRSIGRIMKEYGLVSSYTVAQYKPHPTRCNEAKQANVLYRKFEQEQALSVVVSDLTYVRVGSYWNYVCFFVDLFNREIIGYSAGPHKDAKLVYRALASIKGNLNDIQLFHTDRGNEFKNKLIDDALKAFQIERSLSMKGCPYDNAVAEATFKIFKTEFVKKRHFESLAELTTELHDYVHWFNHIRIHGSLDYLSLAEFKQRHHKKIV